MKKRVSIGMLITVVLLAMALTVSVTMLLSIRYFNATVSDVAERQTMFDYVTDIDRIVRYQYVGSIDEEKLRQSLGEGYVDGIGDPYAAYLSVEEYQVAQDLQKGKQNGFGVEIAQSDDGRIVVTRVHAYSTADKAGLQKGDIITAFNGREVKVRDYASISRSLQTASQVLMTVSRGEETLAFEISTGSYDVASVEGELLDGTVGYIRLYAIWDNTPEQFQTVYTRLGQEGATRYIFDLRDNTGGSADAVNSLLSILVPSGAYAQEKDKAGNLTYLHSEKGAAINVPCVTLVNATTAGEAELFAGVLQELGVASVVGETTAGKGLIQRYFVNTDGSAVRISVAERMLIKGGAIEGVGITPDETASLNGQLSLITPSEDTPLQAALTRVKAIGNTAVTTPPTLVTRTDTTTTATDNQTTATTAQ